MLHNFADIQYEDFFTDVFRDGDINVDWTWDRVKKRKEFSMSKVLNRGLLSALLAFAVFAAVPESALAWHSLGNYHWARTSNPVNLKLGNNVGTAWDASLNETITDWSESNVLDLTKVTGGTAAKPCRATAGRVEVCSAKYGHTNWLGIAQIWASGAHITQAIVKVNDTYFNTKYANGYYDSPEWRKTVMCQEVGHTFGLDHQDENFDNPPLDPPTCMDYSDPPLSNPQPNTHDYDELATIYEHLDSTTTVDQAVQSAPGRGKMPPAMADLEIEGPGQWGKLIHSSHGGWKETYELDFGGGHKIITHVIWATADDDSHDHEHGHH